MKQIQFSVNCRIRPDRGHTLLELLVSLGLTMTIAAIISVATRAQMDVYITDIGRKRVQNNLRGAVDILAMNIRQAGEGLDKTFPAILLSQDDDTGQSILTLRRKILHEVLLVCKAINIGDVKVFVSDSDSADADCLPVNLADSVNAWKTYRTTNDGQIRIYAYNQVNHTGEYLSYSTEGVDDGDDFLTVNALTHSYAARSTSLYVIEEYEFSLNTETNTLTLNIDGTTDEPNDVAYNITQFNVSLRPQTGAILNSLKPDDAVSWHDLRSVLTTISGEETWRQTTVNRSLSTEYFPRNVMSN